MTRPQFRTSVLTALLVLSQSTGCSADTRVGVVQQAESTGACGPALSDPALTALVARVFTGDPDVPDAQLQAEAFCVARYESEGCPLAENINRNSDGTESSHDLGLWQINSTNWPTCVPAGQDPHAYLGDPTRNARCALTLWRQGGKTWKWWAVWNTCKAILGE